MLSSRKRQRIEDSGNSTAGPIYLILHTVYCDGEDYSEMHTDHPGQAMFFDQPRLFKGDKKDCALRGKQQVLDLEALLEDRPGNSFVVLRKYYCERYHESNKVSSSFTRLANEALYGQVPSHVRPFLFGLATDTVPATPVSEKIGHCSKNFIEAMKRIQGLNLSLVELLHGWNDYDGLVAPYPQLYHTRTLLKDISKKIHGSDKLQLDLLLQYLELRFGHEYREADDLFKSGFVTKDHFEKLFGPGQIVTKQERGQHTAFRVKLCPQNLSNTKRLHCETWTFHGSFQKKDATLQVSCPPGPGRVPISTLSVIPLQFDRTGLEQQLMDRGRFFWNCRNGGLVTSVAPRQGFEIKLVSAEQSALIPPRPGQAIADHCPIDTDQSSLHDRHGNIQ